MTGKFISGSPPKKSTSRFLRFPLCLTSQSSAFLPVSALSRQRLCMWYSPVSAKQYLQRRLQSCAACRHMALTTPLSAGLTSE